MKKHNFSAGPSVLNQAVLQKASKAVIELDDTGLSILEISHRSQYFNHIITQANLLIRELLNITAEYEILFLQGGASLQFYMSALNFTKTNGTCGYVDTGTWSSKAINEAEKICNTLIVASSKDKNYTYIPKLNFINSKLDYLHLTSNNTIYGTQFHQFPSKIDIGQQNTNIICDMSSDILSRKFDINYFDLIYAGAQKNIGPAGTTIIIVKKDKIKNKNLPTYLSYSTHINKKSLFNTPPVFSIYVCMLTLQWIKEKGGLSKIDEINRKKAKLLYNTIDQSSIFQGIANKADRSIMNVTFKLKEEYKQLESKFNSICMEHGIVGINGHRSIGGYRASIYNALNIESVKLLTDIMKDLNNKL